MAYIPKNKYQTLYTSGRKYRLVNETEPYIGEYILLNDGRVFAGNSPSDVRGELVELYPIRNNNVRDNALNNRIYSALQEKLSLEQDNYIPIPSSSPTPGIVDYSNGYFKRYFSVRLNTKKYQEISKDVYENFNKRKYNTKLNKVFFIKWSLVENNNLENFKKLNQLEYNLPGISKFLPNVGKYGIKNGIIYISGTSKLYIDGTSVPKKLPISYQAGNPNPNEIRNVNVPVNHHCAGCEFYSNRKCSKWESEVKPEFYCRAFLQKGSQPPPNGGGSY